MQNKTLRNKSILWEDQVSLFFFPFLVEAGKPYKLPQLYLSSLCLKEFNKKERKEQVRKTMDRRKNCKLLTGFFTTISPVQ